MRRPISKYVEGGVYRVSSITLVIRLVHRVVRVVR